ncbi:MAG: methionine--tRNA ligase [Anaerolineae bacterium]
MNRTDEGDTVNGDGAERWYVTTAIPYVNARPHIGFALEAVLTDALARHHRLRGDDTRALTGTDENSLKNVQAAESEGVPTKELVDRYAEAFRDLEGALDLSFDDFIRTSAEARHLEGVRRLWEACEASGDVYKQPYEGLYCVGCEVFYTEDELEDGLCPEHKTPPELVREENYFFRLSKYQDQLLDLIESGRLEIVPETRRNEVLSFVRAGLRDFSISRSTERAHGWGVPVPGDPEQVMYVWFDALGNYITALGYADDGDLYERYWVGNPSRVHVIGKGITRFHAVYWPAMLLSAGVPLPTTIFVHGYVTIGGDKISKSLGNVIDPVTLAEEYGSEALRYYLLREIRSTHDGDFTIERFVRTHNAHLADQLGNLLSRTTGMIERYFDGRIPAPGVPDERDRALIELADGLAGRVDDAVERFATHEALGEIWSVLEAANKYVVEVEPWALAKRRDDPDVEARLATALYVLAEVLRVVAQLLQAFLPRTADELARRLSFELSPDDVLVAARWGGTVPGTAVERGAVLFPKLELPPEGNGADALSHADEGSEAD